MTSTRPIGAAFVRASAVAALFFLACGHAFAVVKDAGHGISVDRTVAPRHRGGETLHAARIDRRAFEAAASAGRTLDLPGTGGAPQRARFARIEHGEGNWTWVGHVDTALGEQSVVVTFGPDAVFGTVPQKAGLPLRIESLRGKAWVIEGEQRRVRGADDASIPQALRSPEASRLLQAARLPDRTAPQHVESVTIDVLVMYTPSMVARYGSDPAVHTRLAHLAAITNTAFHDSPAFARIRVMAMLPLNYTIAGQNGTLLDLVTQPSTSMVKSQVDSWRNQFAADLVAVVRSYDNATQENCGQAWIGGYHESEFSDAHGFSVVSDGSSNGWYCDDLTFAHELGHNLGGHHDIDASGGDYGHYDDSRGFRKTLPDGSGFATIMAYPVGNDVHLGRYSNYRLALCMANYCGDSETANMVGTINYTAYEVAKYRGSEWWFWETGPRVSITPSVRIVEGNSGSKQAWFRVSLEETSSNPVFFELGTYDFGYPGAPDYIEPVPGTVLSIPAGGLYRDVSITILGDTVAETDETIHVHLKNVSGGYGIDSATLVIANDDKPTLTIADVTTSEGNSGTKTMNFTVSLSGPTSTPVTFNVATITPTGTTATPNSDFVPFNAPLQMPVGTQYKQFSVTLKGDTVPEANEIFIVSLTNVVGATVLDGAARATIVNDDPPHLTIDDVAVLEGHSGTRQLVFTLRLSQPATSWVYATPAITIPADSGLTTEDLYYSLPMGGAPLLISPGQQARTFQVGIRGDTRPEIDESFVFSVDNVQGATVIDGAAKGTILNDDTPVMTIGDVSMPEGNSGNPLATFTVQLNGPASAPVTFDIATLATATTTATPGTDYVARSLAGRVIPVGASSAVFNVGLIGDTIVEGSEVFIVTLANVRGATLGDGAARATIVNDD